MYEPKDRIKNVFLYIRQSTDEAAKRQVRSLSDQTAECEALAERLGLNIVDVFREDQSAKRPHQRPIFKAMLKELSYKSAAKRRADGILAWHPDRLSRNALEAGMIIQMLDDELIKDMFFPAYSFHNDPSGKEHLFIEFARAKGYSDHLSVSVKRGTFGREKEGAMVYPIKFGYQKRREFPDKPNQCSLFPVACPIDFPIVQRIYKLRIQGYSLNAIEQFLVEEGHVPTTGKLTKTRLARIASDTFYFGKWKINSGKSTERIIDLNAIKLADGTAFQPVVSETEFWEAQSGSRTAKRAHARIKHINPFPMPILCDRCGMKMRPCWKKVKRAGGRLEDQLGYECQTRLDNGVLCKQPRIKADIIYGHVADALANITIDKKSYHRFLIGSEKFLQNRTKRLRSQRIRQNQAVGRYRKQKLDLLKQKAVLAETGSISSQDRKLIDQQLADIGKNLDQAEQRQKQLAHDIQYRTVRFRKFIELSQSLHGNWLAADIGQKQKISEKILLNLTVENREIRSQTWENPFKHWLKGGYFLDGRAACTKLEPKFEAAWKALDRAKMDSWL